MATITKKPINEKSDAHLIHAHFFFVDIVGLSDPELSTKNQIRMSF